MIPPIYQIVHLMDYDDYSLPVYICQPSNGHFFLLVVAIFIFIHIMDDAR